jgi:hypothetical protein
VPGLLAAGTAKRDSRFTDPSVGRSVRTVRVA